MSSVAKLVLWKDYGKPAIIPGKHPFRETGHLFRQTGHPFRRAAKKWLLSRRNRIGRFGPEWVAVSSGISGRFGPAKSYRTEVAELRAAFESLSCLL